ncbi:hypothetical protein KUCAC02_007995, partial [Chaenocephalus aceratus]
TCALIWSPDLCHYFSVTCTLLLSPTPSFFFSPIVPGHTLFLSLSFSRTISITQCTSNLSLLFINPLDDTVPHLAPLFILHNSPKLELLSPSL